MKQAKPAWFEAEQGVIIRRYTSDDLAAWELAAALDHGWTILNHSVVQSPSWGMYFIIFAFASRTEHVITFSKTG